MTHTRPKRFSLATKDALWGYLFVTPQTLGFLAFVLGPIIAVFVFSLQSRNLLSGQSAFVGLENFQTALQNDPLFWKVITNSLIFTAGLVPLNLMLALALASLLAQPLRGGTCFRALFFAPVITSTAAWIIVWRFMLQGEQGTVNQFLKVLGVSGPNWLREPAWAMISVIVTRVIKGVGLNTVILLAAIKSLPPEFMEAARIDGANEWQVFRRVKLPLLAPTLMLVTIITVIGSLQVFDHIILLTQGGPSNATMVLVYYIYYQAFRIFETGYASALAVILFVVALAFTALQWALRRRVSYNEV